MSCLYDCFLKPAKWHDNVLSIEDSNWNVHHNYFDCTNVSKENSAVVHVDTKNDNKYVRPLVVLNAKGQMIADLCGMAVIPRKEYEELTRPKSLLEKVYALLTHKLW